MAADLTIYTDRSHFDTDVGPYTRVPLTNPTIYEDINKSLYQATYDGLITFSFDLVGGVGVNNDGTVTLGMAGLTAYGSVLIYTTAFGFDIVRANSQVKVRFTVGTTNLTIPLNSASFFGIVSKDTAPISVYYDPQPSPGSFTIQNVSILTPVSAPLIPVPAPQGLRVE